MNTIDASIATWNIAQSSISLPSGDSKEQLREVATEFESLLAKQMLDSMRKTLNSEGDIFYGGMAQDIFEDMLYTEYARVFAKTGSLGIAELIYSQYQDAV